jgi:3-hydroxyisobutyrate dehydrogenase-like beta-hydroxyacid dehydrogenase
MSEQTSLKIAFLGLGIMGAEFARTAARRGLQVTGWDRAPARAVERFGGDDLRAIYLALRDGLTAAVGRA